MDGRTDGRTNGRTDGRTDGADRESGQRRTAWLVRRRHDRPWTAGSGVRGAAHPCGATADSSHTRRHRIRPKLPSAAIPWPGALRHRFRSAARRPQASGAANQTKQSHEQSHDSKCTDPQECQSAPLCRKTCRQRPTRNGRKSAQTARGGLAPCGALVSDAARRCRPWLTAETSRGAYYAPREPRLPAERSQSLQHCSNGSAADLSFGKSADCHSDHARSQRMAGGLGTG